MPEPILCPDCGHDIAQHEPGEYCNGCIWNSDIGALDCTLTPAEIAHAYADLRVRGALEAEPSDAEIDAATEELCWDEPGDWGATRNALKAALKVRAVRGFVPPATQQQAITKKGRP